MDIHYTILYFIHSSCVNSRLVLFRVTGRCWSLSQHTLGQFIVSSQPYCACLWILQGSWCTWSLHVLHEHGNSTQEGPKLRFKPRTCFLRGSNTLPLICCNFMINSPKTPKRTPKFPNYKFLHFDQICLTGILEIIVVFFKIGADV